MDERFMEAASEREQRERDLGVAMVHAVANAPESHPAFDGAHCVACDDPIPLARLKMGKVRCVKCQSIKEKYGAYAI